MGRLIALLVTFLCLFLQFIEGRQLLQSPSPSPASVPSPSKKSSGSLVLILAAAGSGVAVFLLGAAIVGFILWRCHLARSDKLSISRKPLREDPGVPMQSPQIFSTRTPGDANLSPMEESQAIRARRHQPPEGDATPPNGSHISGRTRRFTQRELQTATSNYSLQIGSGAFGPVYKAELPGGQEVAVKVMRKLNLHQGELEFQAEVLLLGRLHHKNLVNLVGFCSHKELRALVYEYMPQGSLEEHLHSITRTPLPWKDRMRIIKEVAQGIEYLHEGAWPPVTHRDIKSANVLLGTNMEARVADFGLSKSEGMEDSFRSTAQGTVGYLDPSYISTLKYTQKSDVYSYGVLVFEIVSGISPLQGLIEHVAMASLKERGWERWSVLVDPRVGPEFAPHELDVVCSLAFRCLRKSPRRRPHMRHIISILSKLDLGSQLPRHLWQSSYRSSRPSSMEGEVSIPPSKLRHLAGLELARAVGRRSFKSAWSTGSESSTGTQTSGRIFSEVRAAGRMFLGAISPSQSLGEISSHAEELEPLGREGQPQLSEEVGFHRAGDWSKRSAGSSIY